MHWSILRLPNQADALRDRGEAVVAELAAQQQAAAGLAEEGEGLAAALEQVKVGWGGGAVRGPLVAA
jgi:hypothetical protein